MNKLLLERYALNLATPDERARVEASPEALAAIEDMKRDNAALFVSQPPAAVATRVLERAGKAPRTLSRWWVSSAVAVACCAVVFIVARPRTDESVAGDAPDVTHAKGIHPQLTLYRQVGTAAERLTDGAIARAGDTLQVAYIAGERTFGAIVSVDGRGSTTVHPLGTDGKLSQRGEVVLPRAYTLDDAPRFERFVFVAAAQAVDSQRLAQALHDAPDATGLNEKFAGADVVVFTVRKAAQ